eukprot:8879472-Pyramimonas_sp.AAC.1
MAPRGPRRGPRPPQRPPSWRKGLPKRPWLCGRWLKSALGWPQDGARALDDSPRLLPDGHKGHQEGPGGRRVGLPRANIKHPQWEEYRIP